MKTQVNILEKNDCFRAGKALRPKGIVVHSTATEQKRISAYTRQWNRPGVRKCVHGFIGLDDGGELIFEQNLPYTVQCWGCGSGKKGSYNQSHIQFEICEALDDAGWCARTYAAALELCAGLCSRFGIEPENVVSHREAHALGYASNHGDVEHWWQRHGFSMEDFRRELRDRMLNTEENYQVFRVFMERWQAEQNELPASPYAQEACRKAVASGLFADGDGNGSLDHPQATLKRQELAVIMDRKGELG